MGLLLAIKKWWNQREETENKDLIKKLGLPEMQPLAEESTIIIFCFADADFTDHRPFRTVVAHRHKPATIPEGKRLVELSLTLKYIFEVPQYLVRRGCHGKYSLKEFANFNSLYGGDPICGGDIRRNLFPPREMAVEARRALNNVLRADSFMCLAEGKPQESLPTSGGFDHKWLEAYIGELPTVQRYFEINLRKSIKSLDFGFITFRFVD